MTRSILSLSRTRFATGVVTRSDIGRGIFSKKLLVSSLAAITMGSVAQAQVPVPQAAEEIVVTGSREATLRAETPSSVSVINDMTLEQVKPAHPSEILNRVPGVTVQQTNGEGHITGIRQPIGTSPVYLFLEDGVPVRASGFFNHNALYEINMAMAGGIEVTRGPGTALQGSDAIGGVVNVLTRAPSEDPEGRLTFEGGSHDWLRMMGSASNTWGDYGVRGDLNITSSGGWRDHTGYDRQSLTLRADRTFANDSHLKATFSASNIEQETGANSALLWDQYRDTPKHNNFPIAYRQVQSMRGAAEWSVENGPSLLTVTPYFRWSEMDLLATFMLNFDPTDYTTGYRSAGMLVTYRYDFEPLRTRLITGLDLDYSPGFRKEDRIIPLRDGALAYDYLRDDRIYDYDVTFWQASPYVQVETSPTDRIRVTAGLRYDAFGYDYDNKLASGAFTTPLPFGPGTMYRPADTTVDYSRLSPSIGATYEFTSTLNGFLSYKQSFRVPQESNLFRQGSNLNSLDLKPVVADSYEAGLRGRWGSNFMWDLSIYDMTTSDDILTLNLGFGPTQTNNGKSRHRGVEVVAGWIVVPGLRLDLAAGYAKHEYKDWMTSTSVDLSGNEMNSAPRQTANAILNYIPLSLPALSMEAEWQYMGSYWMDPANTQKYDGHDLVNLRASYTINNDFEVFARVTNLLDTRWATTASISGGEGQYAPGMPRSLFGGITMRF